MSLNINIATNRSVEERQESETASVRLCGFRPYLWCQQYRAGIQGSDPSPVEFPIPRDSFICLWNVAFELKMTLAFIFIETLTHRIITPKKKKKKQLQIKTRKDIQEEIGKQSSPYEWVFFFFFMSTQHTLIHYSEMDFTSSSLHFGGERSGASTPCGDWGLYPRRQLCVLYILFFNRPLVPYNA